MEPAIARLSSSDLAEAGAMLDAAYGRRGMIAGLQRAFSLQPDNWLCARRDGRIVATVGAHDYGPVASIGLMAVHPSVQRQGVGEKLMNRLLADLDARGCPLLCLDASADGQYLYPRLGFVPEGETLRMARVRSVEGVAEPDPEGRSSFEGDGVRVRLLREGDLEEVIRFDAPFFGVHRGMVIRAFWGSDPGRAFFAVDAAGRVAGYLIAEPGHIGPWVATSLGAAELLLAAARSLTYDRPPSLSCPAANTDAVSLLERHGFVVTERLLHMRRGGAADPRQPRFLYAQASLSLG